MAKNPPLQLTTVEIETLERLVRLGSTPNRMVFRSRIVLMSNDGKSGYEIAQQLDTDVHTVYKWRKRFVEQRLEGLKDRYRSGQPVKLTEKQVKTILDLTVHSIPAEATAWSVRLMSKAAGVTYYQVLKAWHAAGLKPHLIETFKLSKDPLFSEKVTDIIGLYMNPPDNAFVLSVDEKTQIQALDRTQPMLQLREGQVERQTHDYVRHGTTSLYAAFDIIKGNVLAKLSQRHRAKEFLSFLNYIDRRMQGRREVESIHIIVDNSSTHKTKEVREWIEEHPKYVFHFTPTSASWLNAVEGWFTKLERRGLYRKAVGSVKELREWIGHFVVTYNKKSAKPLVWTKEASTVLASVQRAKEALEQQTERLILE